MQIGPYSQHFVTYEWTQYAGVLHYSGLKRLDRDKHFSLLGLFKRYKEYEVFWIQHQESWTTLPHFKDRLLDLITNIAQIWKNVGDEHSSFLSTAQVRYEVKK